MKILGVSAGPKQSSKTLIAVNAAIEYAKVQQSDVDVELINVCERDIQFCDARDPRTYTGDTKQLIDKIVEADALIFGTPIYRGTYTGILKNVFDLIPNDSLVGKPIGIVATAGSYHHYLALEHELKPIFGFFMALVIPGMVYIVNSDFKDGKIVSTDVNKNLEKMSISIIAMLELLPKDREKILGGKGVFM